jgi:hypothetical protein
MHFPPPAQLGGFTPASQRTQQQPTSIPSFLHSFSTPAMQFTLATLLSVPAATASAHTTVCSIYVGGVDWGDGRNTYISSPPNNNPANYVSSSAIRCNVNDRAVLNRASAKVGTR